MSPFTAAQIKDQLVRTRNEGSQAWQQIETLLGLGSVPVLV